MKQNKFLYYALVLLRFVLAVFMINAGVQHFLKPAFYIPFVPVFLPLKELIIFSSGVLELALGLSLFFPKRISQYGALAIFALMLLFLPIHLADLFLENPAIGSHGAAWIRFFVQFIFIAWAYAVYRFLRTNRQRS